MVESPACWLCVILLLGARRATRSEHLSCIPERWRTAYRPHTGCCLHPRLLVCSGRRVLGLGAGWTRRRCIAASGLHRARSVDSSPYRPGRWSAGRRVDRPGFLPQESLARSTSFGTLRSPPCLIQASQRNLRGSRFHSQPGWHVVSSIYSQNKNDLDD